MVGQNHRVKIHHHRDKIHGLLFHRRIHGVDVRYLLCAWSCAPDPDFGEEKPMAAVPDEG